jgi:hypothetical protein
MERFWPKSNIVNYLLGFFLLSTELFLPSFIRRHPGASRCEKEGYFLTKVIRYPKIPIGGAYTGKAVSARK